MKDIDLSKYWVDEETPYIHEDKVIELINQAYKKGYIDGAIAEAKSLTDFLKKKGE